MHDSCGELLAPESDVASIRATARPLDARLRISSTRDVDESRQRHRHRRLSGVVLHTATGIAA